MAKREISISRILNQIAAHQQCRDVKRPGSDLIGGSDASVVDGRGTDGLSEVTERKVVEELGVLRDCGKEVKRGGLVDGPPRFWEPVE